MSTEYTPTLHDLREAYANYQDTSAADAEERRREFDRAISLREREVAAKTLGDVLQRFATHPGTAPMAWLQQRASEIWNGG